MIQWQNPDDIWPGINITSKYLLAPIWILELIGLLFANFCHWSYRCLHVSFLTLGTVIVDILQIKQLGLQRSLKSLCGV